MSEKDPFLQTIDRPRSEKGPEAVSAAYKVFTLVLLALFRFGGHGKATVSALNYVFSNKVRTDMVISEKNLEL